jgi:TRAP-type C4-dicarboxylate transport system permease small subunit
MKWLNRIADGLAILGGLTAVALVCVTVISVFWRYILDDPIFGVDDLSRMMLAVVVAGSIGYGARTGAHVYVDILSLVGGDRVTRVTDVIVRIIGAGVVAAATWALWLESLCGFECGEFTDNLGIIHTPFYRLLAAGMAVYCGILVLELFVGPTDKPGKPGNRRRDDAGPR